LRAGIGCAEFFLKANQTMPVKGKFLEEATPVPFVTSSFT